MSEASILHKDNFLARAFLDTQKNVFANSFPLSANPEIAFSPEEFRVAMARKLGCPIALLESSKGVRINTTGRSNNFFVDPHGHGLATATGCKGDHPRTHHDKIIGFVVSLLRSQGVTVRGGRGSCSVKDIFAGSIRLDPSLADETTRKRMQGIIPDMLIDGRGLTHGPFASTVFDNCQLLVELKTLASLATSVKLRAAQIQRYRGQREKARRSSSRLNCICRTHAIRTERKVSRACHRPLWKPVRRLSCCCLFVCT